MKSIFRAVITQRLDSNSVKVQRYFEGALELLTHKKSHGFQQSEILKAALEWQELVRPGERETLLAKLNEAVPNYRRNIEQLIRRADGEARQPAQLANYVQNVFVTEGDFNMSSINTSGTGNIVNVAEYMVGVTNSVNQNVNNSQTSSEVKDLVKVLMENIAKIGPSVDPNIAKQMADDVKVLSEELTRPAPRKAWYEISLKGLKEAAEAIGEIGKPILETAMKLFPLLIGG
ncbi:MAG TPA: hypothetical protein VNW47_11320 [Terriglobales bacterium]|nr:hypothetical protein [Terriglobales bacterium]